MLFLKSQVTARESSARRSVLARTALVLMKRVLHHHSAALSVKTARMSDAAVVRLVLQGTRVPFDELQGFG